MTMTRIIRRSATATRPLWAVALIVGLSAGDVARLVAQSQREPQQVLDADGKLAKAVETIMPTDPNFHEGSPQSLHAQIKFWIGRAGGDANQWKVKTTTWGAIVYQSADGRTEFWGQLQRNGSLSIWKREYTEPRPGAAAAPGSPQPAAATPGGTPAPVLPAGAVPLPAADTKKYHDQLETHLNDTRNQLTGKHDASGNFLDSNGNAVAPTAINGAILTRDVFVADENAYIQHLDGLVNMGLQDKRNLLDNLKKQVEAFHDEWQKYTQAKYAAKSLHDEYQTAYNTNIQRAEQLEKEDKATGQVHTLSGWTAQQYRDAAQNSPWGWFLTMRNRITGMLDANPLMALQKDGKFFFETMYDLWRTDATNQQYMDAFNGYLASAKDQATKDRDEAQNAKTFEEVWKFGGPKYSKQHVKAAQLGSTVGATLPALHVGEITAVFEGYTITKEENEEFWNTAKDLGLNVLAAGSLLVPFGPIIAAGVVAIQITRDGSDLVVSYLNEQEARNTANVTGWTHVITAEEKTAAAGNKLLFTTLTGIPDLVMGGQAIANIRFVKGVRPVTNVAKAAEAGAASATAVKADAKVASAVTADTKVANAATADTKVAVNAANPSPKPAGGFSPAAATVANAQQAAAEAGLQNRIQKAVDAGVITPAQGEKIFNETKLANTFEETDYSLTQQIFAKEHPNALVITNDNEIYTVGQVKQKAALEAQGKPQRWSKSELEKLKQLGDDPNWTNKWEQRPIDDPEPGFHPAGTADDAANVKAAAANANNLTVVDDAVLYGTGAGKSRPTAAKTPTGASVGPDNAATKVGPTGTSVAPDNAATQGGNTGGAKITPGNAPTQIGGTQPAGSTFGINPDPSAAGEQLQGTVKLNTGAGATSPTVKVNAGPEATAPTVKVGDGTVKMNTGPESASPTVKVGDGTVKMNTGPESASPTVKVSDGTVKMNTGPEATAPTVKVNAGPQATSPTVKVNTGAEATAPTIKTDGPSTSSTPEIDKLGKAMSDAVDRDAAKVSSAGAFHAPTPAAGNTSGGSGGAASATGQVGIGSSTSDGAAMATGPIGNAPSMPGGAAMATGAVSDNGDASGCAMGDGICVSDSSCSSNDCVNVQQACTDDESACTGGIEGMKITITIHQVMMAGASAANGSAGAQQDEAQMQPRRPRLWTRAVGWLLQRRRDDVSAERLFRPGTIVHAVAEPAAGPPPSREIGVAFVANGASTGVAFDVQVLDRSGKTRRVAVPEGTVLQPYRQGPAPSSSAARRGAAAAHQVGAFCLDFAKLPPTPGMLYKVADRATQEKFSPLRTVLQSARQMAGAGLLHPDSNPVAYVDAIKQYALWARRERWDGKTFAEAFVERTKKNVLAMKQNWTKEMESVVMSAAPGRWRDISAVLDQADAIARSGKSRP